MIDSYNQQQMFADLLREGQRFLLVFPEINLSVFFDFDSSFVIEYTENRERTTLRNLEHLREKPNYKCFFDFFEELLYTCCGDPTRSRGVGWFWFDEYRDDVAKIELPNSSYINRERTKYDRLL